jgi:hypothetical protein
MPTNDLVAVNHLPPYTNQPILAYPMREKLDLPKFDGNEKQGMAWFNKADEYLKSIISITMMKKSSTPPNNSREIHTIGTCGGRSHPI